jgi:predicted glycosyltransferase
MDSKSARFPRAVVPAGVRETRSLPDWGPRVHPAQPSLLLYSGNQDVSWGAQVVRSTLAQALSTRFRVVVVGDSEVASPVGASSPIQTISLPPLGSPNAERDRRRILVSTCATLQPRVIVVEQYPFGDLHLGAEILHALDAAAANVRTPLVISSVRQLPDGDMLSGAEVYAARSTAEAYFDAVLVHTDPTISRLPDDRTESDARWSAPVRYTGFISADPRGPADIPSQAVAEGGEIVVFGEGGGGRDRLCQIAVDACTHLAAADRLPMRIIAGLAMPETDYRALEEAAAGTAGVTVERSVPDVRTLLATAAVAVSHCSFPLLDVVRSRVPALVIPTIGGDDAATTRARRLARIGVVRLVEPEWLDGSALACQIASTIGFTPHRVDLDLSGAHATVRFLTSLVDAANRFSAADNGERTRFAPAHTWQGTRFRT